MIHRAFAIPISNENLRKEIATIKYIATRNGFEVCSFDRLISRKLKKFALGAVYSEETVTRNFKTITHNGDVSEKVVRILRQQDIEVALRPPTSLAKEIANNKQQQNGKVGSLQNDL